MRLLDRHVTLFSGSLRTLLRRESDRRRCADSPYAWLFQPYMGEELVALACTATPTQSSPVISVAAVVLSHQQVHTSRAFVITLGSAKQPASATLRRHHLLCEAGEILPPNSDNLSALVEFIGNRPIVGWQLEKRIGALNALLSKRLNFALPNAQVDVAKLHQRQLRRLHPEVEAPSSFAQALACWQVPVMGMQSVLGEATASALLYMRLQRIMAQVA
ncbi:DNA polymerase III subunit epsilon [Vreelandella titanicae]|uniref:DNA polymerase III subunit epsilon n=1 Tax=Halomonadaceae TaxID=28256 RepID=UPI00059B4579|nr:MULTISPECIES: DNA polymerase III subunit epsilon [Halomonas]KIN14169.1 DNA polymerase III subunit epsilon [Halomonas sp. KHS3]MCD1588737.1 DNA polymerase III subunit epsilon [Halomonas sp. IOP_14]MCE7520047.1 DNA polymerase III subunit epsilon [Halomonas titanicae]